MFCFDFEKKMRKHTWVWRAAADATISSKRQVLLLPTIFGGRCWLQKHWNRSDRNILTLSGRSSWVTFTHKGQLTLNLISDKLSKLSLITSMYLLSDLLIVGSAHWDRFKRTKYISTHPHSALHSGHSFVDLRIFGHRIVTNARPRPSARPGLLRVCF